MWAVRVGKSAGMKNARATGFSRTALHVTSLTQSPMPPNDSPSPHEFLASLKYNVLSQPPPTPPQNCLSALPQRGNGEGLGAVGKGYQVVGNVFQLLHRMKVYNVENKLLVGRQEAPRSPTPPPRRIGSNGWGKGVQTHSTEVGNKPTSCR